MNGICQDTRIVSPQSRPALSLAATWIVIASWAAGPCLLVPFLFGQASPGQSPPPSRPAHRVRLAPQPETAERAPQRWFSRPLSTQVGTIVEFDADQIAILIDDQTVPTRFASQRVLDIQTSDLPEDQAAAIDLYEQGEKLRQHCQARLDAAQARIEKIVAGPDGKAQGTQPFDAD